MLSLVRSSAVAGGQGHVLQSPALVESLGKVYETQESSLERCLILII